MPSFCNYMNCHNLASSTYHGYCDEYHMKRAKEIEPLMRVIEEVPGVKSIGEARKYLISTLRLQQKVVLPSVEDQKK
jgi:uncharacterized protein (DUF1499 family)